MLLGLTLGLAIGVFQIGVDLHAQRAAVDKRVGELLDSMRGPAFQAVFELDTRLARRVVRGMLVNRVVRRVRIVDDVGTEMASASRDRAPQRLDWLADYLFAHAPYRLDLHHAIGGASLGALEVTIDTGPIASDFLARSWLVVLGGMLRNLVLAALLALMFHRLLTRPLLALVRTLAAHEVESGGVRVAMPRGHEDDELGLLAGTVNEMLERVDQALAERRRAQAELASSRAQLHAVIDNAPAEIHLKDREGRYLLVNRRFEESFGCREADVRGRRPSEVVEEQLATFAERQDADVLARDRVIEREQSVRRGDEVTTTLMIKFPVRDGDGSLIGTGGVGLDISERERITAALRASEQRFRDIADATSDWFWETDAELRLVYVSDRLAELTGRSAAEFIGEPLASAIGETVDPEARQRLASKRAFRDLRFQVAGERDGVRYWSLSAKPILGPDGEFAGYRGTGSDITRDHELASELAYQASHDGLTGLLNRQVFEARLERVIDSVRASGGEHAVCYLDLDQFKVVNDTCGHVAGDELLRQLGALIAAEVRKRDTLARLGGDEFGVLLERCTARQARRVAEAIRRAVQDFRFNWGESSFRMGVSIGLVPVAATSAGAVDVLATADAACYAAKDEGRNRIHEYRVDDERIAQRSGEMRWVGRIHRALDENAFELHYQEIAPLAAPADGGRRFELLVRLRRSNGELAPPGAFLPAAERYGLAVRLDRWVVSHAFAWLRGDARRLASIRHCAINLSGQSLGDEEFMRMVAGELGVGDIDPGAICFEITETAAIANLANAMQMIRSLRSVGCRFALDDFGSGLSSFAYLKNLPVDYLKIDGAFVRDLRDDATDRAMVRTINDLGHVMGKQTIAEFVEDDSLIAMLREIGVDYGQGYAIAHPRPLAEFA